MPHDLRRVDQRLVIDSRASAQQLNLGGGLDHANVTKDVQRIHHFYAAVQAGRDLPAQAQIVKTDTPGAARPHVGLEVATQCTHQVFTGKLACLQISGTEGLAQRCVDAHPVRNHAQQIRCAGAGLGAEHAQLGHPGGPCDKVG